MLTLLLMLRFAYARAFCYASYYSALICYLMLRDMLMMPAFTYCLRHAMLLFAPLYAGRYVEQRCYCYANILLVTLLRFH